jgi:hypothetical protein
MKTSPPGLQVIRRRVWFALALLALAAGGTSRAAPLSGDDQQFLSGYVQIHDALVANDMSGVRKAAALLPAGTGTRLASAGSISSARDEFARLTPRAEKLAAGQPQYHVFYCPMAKLDWVQMNTTIANPYLGPDMLSCGVEKK